MASKLRLGCNPAAHWNSPGKTNPRLVIGQQLANGSVPCCHRGCQLSAMMRGACSAHVIDQGPLSAYQHDPGDSPSKLPDDEPPEDHTPEDYFSPWSLLEAWPQVSISLA